MKNLKTSRNRFFFFILTVLCVGVSVFISQFFANVISTSSFSISNISATEISYTLYSLSAKNFLTKTQATEFANDLRSKNSGGYVYELNNKYYVICSIYEHENDAKSVLDNIINNLPSAEIIPITIENVNLSTLSNQNIKKSFLNVFSKIKQTYLELYDISVSLDTSIYSETKALLESSKILEELQSTLDSIPTGSSASEGAYSIIIKTKLKNINSYLNDLINFSSSENYTLSAKIKDTYINIVFENINLVEALNEK